MQSEKLHELIIKCICNENAEIAQLVEHFTRNEGVIELETL